MPNPTSTGFLVFWISFLCLLWNPSELVTCTRVWGQDETFSDEDEGPDEWTLMLYLAGDCDLERAILDNLAETMFVGGNESVNVVALVDRHPAETEFEVDENANGLFSENDIEKKRRYTNRAIGETANWNSVKIFDVYKDELDEFEDLGEANSGAGATLEYFIKQVVENRPAKKYALIIGGHGMAWKSVCPDETSGDSAMNMRSLRKAIMAGMDQKLELLGFDACLMANFEVLHSLQDLTRIVVASEESSPGDGWNYASLVRTITKNPRVDGMAISKSMGEAFFSYFAKADQSSLSTATFSAIDMTRFDAISNRVDRLGEALSDLSRENLDEVTRKVLTANAMTTEYGEGGQGYEGEHLYDLVDFTKHVSREFSNPQISKACRDVSTAVKQATIFNFHGEFRPGSNGMTVYLPFRQGEDLKATLAEYKQIPNSKNHNWFQWISGAEEMAQVEIATELVGEIEVTQETEAGITYLTFETEILRPSEFSSAEFFVARSVGGQQQILAVCNFDPLYQEFLESDEGVVSATFDGEWFELRSGRKSIPCPCLERVEYDDGECYLEAPFLLYDSVNKEWEDIVISFIYVEDEDAYEYDCAYNERFEIELMPGDRLRPLKFILNNDGSIQVGPDKSTTLKIRNPNRLSLDFADIDHKSNVAGFAVEDIRGDLSFKGVKTSR